MCFKIFQVVLTASRCWLALSISWLAACGADRTGGPGARLIHVTGNGLHTGIVMPAPALAATGALPEAAEFEGAVFLEFGWGDRAYYTSKKPTLSMALTAALAPTPAVMHVASIQTSPEDNDSGLKVISLKLTEEGFQNLARAIAAEFERPPDSDRAEPVSRGLYSDSRFYPARGAFHLFNTCNTWTARMLQAGGVAISPFGIITANDLMTRLWILSY